MTKFEYLIWVLRNNEELKEVINSLETDGEVEFIAIEMCCVVDDYFNEEN